MAYPTTISISPTIPSEDHAAGIEAARVLFNESIQLTETGKDDEDKPIMGKVGECKDAAAYLTMVMNSAIESYRNQHVKG